jgi:hypothetical protein
MEIAGESLLVAVDCAVFRAEVFNDVIARTLAEMDIDSSATRASVIERQLREVKIKLSNLIHPLAAAGGGNLTTPAAAMGEHEARPA